ncbi:MAG: tetratricopeptide repeat protein [Bacteroidales bacterium]|nr:tetratricopeptide repeat protein [Bacteroidales bacterium]
MRKYSKHIGIFVSFLLFQFVLIAQSPMEMAEDADDMYKQGQYDEAVSLYEHVLQMGYHSAELYYNLGNSYYRLNNIGRAILNYNRALHLNPHLTDAKENLTLAETKTQDRITTLPQFFVFRWITSLAQMFSPRGWLIMWLEMIALTAVAIFFLFTGKTLTVKKIGLSLSIVMAILLLISIGVGLKSFTQYNSHNRAVVVEPSVSVKSSPEGTSTDKLILHEGTTLIVCDSVSQWYKIKIADGNTGWVEMQSIEKI